MTMLAVTLPGRQVGLPPIHTHRLSLKAGVGAVAPVHTHPQPRAPRTTHGSMYLRLVMVCTMLPMFQPQSSVSESTCEQRGGELSMRWC